MVDFFISLSGKDKAWGDWIAWQLKQAGHESARTTGLYNRADDEVTLDEVERILI